MTARSLAAAYSTTRFLRIRVAASSHRQPSTIPQLQQKPALRLPPHRMAASEAVPVPHRPQQQRRAGGRSSVSSGGPLPTVTLAVVGDVHGQWDADSEAALASLGADVVLFVGDLGNEDTAVTGRIARLPLEKAVVLGNHDAWFSLTERGRQRFARLAQQSASLAFIHAAHEGSSAAATATATVAGARQELASGPDAAGPRSFGGAGASGVAALGDGVTQQLEALGDDHVGFSSKRLPALGLSIVGGRPFSKGGTQWSDVAAFYDKRYSVGSMHDSARWLADLLLQQPEDMCKVVLAHNGPSGLGTHRHNPCGVDWMEGREGDHGDPDLKEALEMAHSQGCDVALVLFGHMHSQLKGGGLRNRAHVCPTSGTVYLNAAVVPRVRSVPAVSVARASEPATAAGVEAAGLDVTPLGSTGTSAAVAALAASGGSISAHHFLSVTLKGGEVTAAADVWVGVLPAGGSSGSSAAAPSSNRSSDGSGGKQYFVLERRELLRSAVPPADDAASNGFGSNGSSSSSGLKRVVSCWQAFTGEWLPVVVPRLQLAWHEEGHT